MEATTESTQLVSEDVERVNLEEAHCGGAADAATKTRGCQNTRVMNVLLLLLAATAIIVLSLNCTPDGATDAEGKVTANSSLKLFLDGIASTHTNVDNRPNVTNTHTSNNRTNITNNIINNHYHNTGPENSTDSKSDDEDKVEVPSLAEPATLTRSELSKFHYEPRPLPTSGGTTSEPPNIEGMFGKDWTMVLKNCNLLRGRKSNSNLGVSFKYLILPPRAETWSSEFYIPSQRQHYEMTITTDQSMRKVAQLASQNAFAGISSPWVSAAFSYNALSEKQSFFTGSEYTMIRKYMAPVVMIYLLPGHHIDTERTGTAPFSVEPDFLKKVETTIETAQSCSDFREKFTDITSLWGDMYCSKALIGVGAWQQVFESISSHQDLQRAEKNFQAAVSGNYPEYQVGVDVGGGLGSSDSTDNGNAQNHRTEAWECIGGNTCDNNDPTSVAKYRNIPNSWRLLDCKEFQPMVRLLPKKILDKANNKCKGEYFTGYMSFSRKDGNFRQDGKGNIQMLLFGSRTTGKLFYDGQVNMMKGKEYPHGRGKARIITAGPNVGATIEGPWVEGKMQGKDVVITFPSKMKFHGDVWKGPVGCGKADYPDGCKYEGCWVNFLKDTSYPDRIARLFEDYPFVTISPKEGKLTCGSRVYVGQFVGGGCQGHGTERDTQKGYVYVGQFGGGQWNGIGKLHMTMKGEQYVYEGQFKFGKRDGKAKETWRGKTSDVIYKQDRRA